MLRGWRSHTSLNYYLAWRITEEMRNEEQQIKRDIKLRHYLRKTLNPTNINEREFRHRYGLSKEAFNFLLEKLRAKTSLKSTKRVSVEHKILCALSFYRTGSYQRLVGIGKHLGQTTVSKYVTEVTNALNNPALLNEVIRFPVTRTERDCIKQKFYTKFGIPGVIGCIDGSHFHIFTPNQEIEHLFFCRKHFHSLNVQMVCDSECRILNVNPKYGGATHDAFIWENSAVKEFMQSLHRNNEEVWLLGDSGYPQRPWMMTPIPDAAEGSPESKYTTIHGKARVVIENTFSRVKNRWRCVCKHRTLHYKPLKCAKIITACCVLHNITIDFNVPDPNDSDEETGGEEFIRTEVQREYEERDTRDDLFRGRALRNVLIERLNRIHN